MTLIILLIFSTLNFAQADADLHSPIDYWEDGKTESRSPVVKERDTQIENIYKDIEADQQALVTNPSREKVRKLIVKMKKLDENTKAVARLYAEEWAKQKDRPTINKRETFQRVDPSRFKMTLYYASYCPSCKSMIRKTVPDLVSKGFSIKGIQTDLGAKLVMSRSMPTRKAEVPEIIEFKKRSGSVPFLEIKSLDSSQTLYVSGYYPATHIIKKLQKEKL